MPTILILMRLCIIYETERAFKIFTKLKASLAHTLCNILMS